MLLQPWQWQTGGYLQKFEEKFEKEVGLSSVWLFNSGRSAFLTALRALGIGPGDEVIIQAFTCVAVPDPIIWAGAKPIYADIDEKTYNLDPESVAQLICQRTKAIVIQHTFGRPAPVKEILALAREHKLMVIEDCAHSLGIKLDGRPLGAFGDVAFFSFGRDKVVSSVFGGALATNDKKLAQKIEMIYRKLPQADLGWIAQQLLHPIITGLFLPWYDFKFARGLIFLFQKIKLLSLAIQPGEYQGQKPNFFPRRYSNALAALVLSQLEQLPALLKHRQTLSAVYAGGPTWPWLRYPWRTKEPRALIKAARRAGFSLGDWYDSAVAPAKTSLKAVGYQKGRCPKAEELARTTVNLPTHIHTSLFEARQLKDWLISHG